MPWTDLPTNFKNLVWSGLKKYIKFDNPDQTVSFEDVTEYEDTDNTQMSAEQLNQMTDAINQMMDGDLFYSKSEVDTKLAGKASSTHNHDSVYLKLIRVASDFSTTQSYAVGDYVIYNGYICRFITDHPAGAWVTAHVSVVTVTDELKRKADTADFGDLAEKDKVDWDTDIDNIPTSFPPESHNHDDRYYTETETDDLLDTKQNTLTFDTTPTASSTNPVTSGGVKTALDNKADVITSSASGNPVTITDGSPAPVVDLTVGIEPVQNLHGLDNPYSNICPISGWTGTKIYHIKENLLTITATSATINGIEYRVNPDGSIVANGTATSSAFLDVGDIDLKANTTYWLAGCPNGGSNSTYQMYYRNVTSGSTMDRGSGASYTPTADEIRTVRIVIYSGITANNLVFRPSISLANDTHNIYNISFPSEAGTVYGGNLDVTTGVLTVTHGLWTFDGSVDENWTFAKADSKYRAVSDSIDGMKTYSGSSRYECLCNIGHFSSGSELYTCFVGASGRVYYYPPSDIETEEAYRAFLANNPMQIVYDLATPQTYQLTPTEVTTLLGENTISADTGAVDVTYRADTKTYIDNKIAESQKTTRSLIAGIETEMIATKNYSIGDLLIVGDTLYKVTANIAITGAITVGTNVTATTVAEQLILLANA